MTLFACAATLLAGVSLQHEVAPATAPQSASAPAPVPNEASLLAAEQDWMHAMQVRDRPTLERRMDSGYTLSDAGESEQPSLPRAVWIDNTMKRLTVTRFAFVDSRAQVAGTTGSVRTKFTWAGAFEGEAFDESGALVDVWAWRDGRWVVLARVLAGQAEPSKPQ